MLEHILWIVALVGNSCDVQVNKCEMWARVVCSVCVCVCVRGGVVCEYN